MNPTQDTDLKITYPDLPVSQHRGEILAALRKHQVVIVAGETGSGKTTQLPKIALEFLGTRSHAKVGCTQPRRLAATTVARRVAAELKCPLGEFVGYQVRFNDRQNDHTRVKFMTDGILLAEIQTDPDLRQYDVLMLDEVHERSLNIDFLLGYLHGVLQRRPELRLIISSATLDIGGFQEFFSHAPVIRVQGRTYPVDIHYMPPLPEIEEELPAHVARAVKWLNELDDRGDILVFLPGEREIRDVAAVLTVTAPSHTEVLPLFARLSLAEQQRIFQPQTNRRRIVLATNVAETSLTIPGIVYVIDSGLVRISRYHPARQVQGLQVEFVSQASARQRAGRCGRLCDGVCIRLYNEQDLLKRPAFTDPEIKRSALAATLLRMKELRLPEMADFPLPDPPAKKPIAEGYRTLLEIGALDKERRLTAIGKRLARLPVDPRLGRMLLAAQYEQSLPELLVIVSGLSVPDPRERPLERQTQADQAHAVWIDPKSDFITLLNLWQQIHTLRNQPGFSNSKLRKWCKNNFLNFTRVLEWINLHEDLTRYTRAALKCKIPPLSQDPAAQASYAMIHRSILAGAPKQFGYWDTQTKEYQGTGGLSFKIFPGSSLFKRKTKAEWVMGVELVNTSRLWLRRAAVLEPEWVEQVAPHLCQTHYSHAKWSPEQGAVYALAHVMCGGLCVINNRRVHYGGVAPHHAREIMIRQGIIQNTIRGNASCLSHLTNLRDQIDLIEHKLRRPGSVWNEQGVFEFFASRLPDDCCTAKSFLKFAVDTEKYNPQELCVPFEIAAYCHGTEHIECDFPDQITYQDLEFPLYYQYAPKADDDGVTIGIHIDQLPHTPDWLPGWGVPGNLRLRVEILLRSLPKNLRLLLQSIEQKARSFTELYATDHPHRPIEQVLAQFVTDSTGKLCLAENFNPSLLPAELVTKLWVCNDSGDELAMGTNLAALKTKLAPFLEQRFQQTARSLFQISGMIKWSCPSLPEQIDVAGTPGFVALTDNATSVGVHVFPRADQARIAHRAGVLRLLTLHFQERLNSHRKRLPLSMQGKLALHTLHAPSHGHEQDLLTLIVEQAAGDCRAPRTAEQFAELCSHCNRNFNDASRQILTQWEQIVLLVPQIEQQIRQLRLNRHSVSIAADMQQQLDWLLQERFLFLHGATRLPDLLRYLQGMLARYQRIQQQALSKELTRLDAFTLIAQAWQTAWQQHRTDPAWQEYGYLLQEFRLLTFAPQIPPTVKVSQKRLIEAFVVLHEI